MPSFHSITSQVFSDGCNFVKLNSTAHVAVLRTNAPRKSYAGVILAALRDEHRLLRHSWTLTKCGAICLSCKHPFTESYINSAWRTAGRRRARYCKSRKRATLLSSGQCLLRNVNAKLGCWTRAVVCRPFGNDKSATQQGDLRLYCR